MNHKDRKIWLISDEHHGHFNIITYEDRPFETTDDVTAHIIKQHNKLVAKNDIVVHLGDFSFSGKERVKFLLSKLNGEHILIMGNHDGNRGFLCTGNRKLNWWQDAGFKRVYDYPIIVDNFYIFSHEPVYLNKAMPYVNIHGHTHSTVHVLGEPNQYVNVCVECLGYKPILFTDIKTKFLSNDSKTEIREYFEKALEKAKHKAIN